MNDHVADEGKWARIHRVVLALLLLSPMVVGFGWTLRLW
jgi:hypothetical protein